MITMNTPKSQHQHSTPLSAAKKGPIKGLKNVLVQPNEMIWPILKDEKEKNELHSILTELLPEKKDPLKVMNWAKLCRLSKEERLTLKKDLQTKCVEENNENVMTSVILGINGVTKSLEKNNLCSVLIDSKVDPLFLIKHIVVMGQNKSIPVLLVPFLKTVTLNKIGFASAALGIKKSVSGSDTEHFYKLHNKISTLMSKFPRIHQPVQFQTDENNMNSESSAEEKCSQNDFSITKTCDSIQTLLVSKSIYKYRSSCKERAFIPPESQPKLEENTKTWTEFIAFNMDDDMPISSETTRIINRVGRYMDIHEKEECSLKRNKNLNDMKSETLEELKQKSTVISNLKVKNTEPTTYIPLKVKRIQGNPKRLKATKIAKSKRKITTKK